MEYSKPEQMGISSKAIRDYIQSLEEAQIPMHDVLIYRHGKIIFEKYWAPFHDNFLHRMYSVTKSFVALGIGFLEQDGLISLDDPISKYFPEEAKAQPSPEMRQQTIRNMLMMSTAKVAENWFAARSDDRLRFYFENKSPARPAGTLFQYDSSGSFVLGALIEKLTGKEFISYLREKFLDEIGFSKEAYCLKCPGGHTWADSALICTAQDLLKAAIFTMQKGKWQGKQLLNEAYVTAATSRLIDNSMEQKYQVDGLGYGYYFWRAKHNSYYFSGMGSQFGLCVPDQDMILVCNADAQGLSYAKRVIMNGFFEKIVETASNEPLPDDPKVYQELEDYTRPLKLLCAKGEADSPMAQRINGLEYTMAENPMGIEKMQLCFEKDQGILRYTNQQGQKELQFGLCSNSFGEFPQDGYSDLVGSQKGNRRYHCAASAAWQDYRTLMIKVQIIDTYFGNLDILLGFRDDLHMGLYMTKTAEDFLQEYQGFASGVPERA